MKRTNSNRSWQQSAFDTEWHLSQPVFELSVWTRLFLPPLQIIDLLLTLIYFWNNPAEMTHCSGGVTLEDNILQKHSLKADLREKIWLLHFLSVVAWLILWHTLCLAASKRSLAVCERKGGQQRKKRKKISRSGWHARTSNALAPRTPRSWQWHSHCVLMAGSFGPTLSFWPQSFSFKSIIENERDIYLSG